MTASDWATIVYSYFFVTAGIGGGLWFVLKKAIQHVVEENREKTREEMKDVSAELRHNGGSSLVDVVKLQLLPLVQELRTSQVEIGQTVSKLEGKFEQHIEEHSWPTQQRL
jgi:hypothetical protein